VNDKPLRVGVDRDARLSLDPRTTALMLIDLQYHDAARGRGFNLAMERARPGSMDYLYQRLETEVIPQSQSLLELARSKGMHIVHVTYGSDEPDLSDMPATLRSRILSLEERSGLKGIFATDSPDFAILPEVAPRPNEEVVRKTTFGAFSSPGLGERLSSVGVTHVVLAGVTTSCCVESTARGAFDTGFGVVVVDSACGDYTASAHANSLESLAMNLGWVVRDVSELNAAFDPTADHEIPTRKMGSE